MLKKLKRVVKKRVKEKNESS